MVKPQVGGCITRRNLLRGGAALAGLGVCAGLGKFVRPLEAMAAELDLGIDEDPSLFCGGNMTLRHNAAEFEGITVVRGDVINEFVYDYTSLCGKVIWGFGGIPSAYSTQLMIGGDYRSTKGARGLSGSWAQVGGSVTGGALEVAKQGVSPLPNYVYDGAEGVEQSRATVRTNMGYDAALQGVRYNHETGAVEPCDYRRYLEDVVRPLSVELADRAATGSVAFSAIDYADQPYIWWSTDIGRVRSSFDGLMTFTGDGASSVQVFDLDLAAADAWLAANGRVQWCVRFDGIPENGVIVVNARGGGARTLRPGWKCWLNGVDASCCGNSLDPVAKARFSDLNSRVLWNFIDATSVTLDKAHGIITAVTPRNPDVEGIGCDTYDAPDYGGRSALWVGSVLVPKGSARCVCHTNGHVLVAGDLDMDCWEHHNTTWIGWFPNESALSKRPSHLDWI